MKKNNDRLTKVIVAAGLISLSSYVFADMTVDRTNGVLTITSDINGTVSAKVIGPDDKIVVNESFSGNSFSWSPSSGPDGAYRYDVRVFPQAQTRVRTTEQSANATSTTNNNYAGGSVEVKNGQIAMGGE